MKTEFMPLWREQKKEESSCVTVSAVFVQTNIKHEEHKDRGN